MKLARINIKNFKSIPPDGVELVFNSSITYLVGKNNVGKSNILEAIERLLGKENPRYSRRILQDYHNPQKPVVIEAEFIGLDFAVGKQLGLSDPQCGKLMSTKGGAHSGHLTLELTLPPLEAEGNHEPQVPSPGSDDEPSETEPTKDTTSIVAYLANKHVVYRIERVRRQLVQLISVPAIRDPEKLLAPSAWTVFGSLLRELLASSENEARLKEILIEADGLIKKDLTTQANGLKRIASSTAYVEGIEFKLTKEGSPTELLRNIEIVVEAHGRKESISNHGTGTQSVVSIGMLELALQNKSTMGTKLFLVEEPELYLHPQAQRFVGQLLRGASAEGRAQLIVTTHSRDVLSGADLLDVSLLSKSTLGGTRVKSVSPSHNGVDLAERYLSGKAAESFFCDRCILVEGESDQVVLHGLSKIVKQADGSSCDFDELNISVVQVGGKESFSSYAAIMELLGIKWRIIADKDAILGTTLDTFRAKGAGQTAPARGSIEEIGWFRERGIAVLKGGEIEDMYPLEPLASLAGLSVDAFKAELAERRSKYEAPTTLHLLTEMFKLFKEEITTTPDNRLHKKIPGWIEQTTTHLKTQGIVAAEERKSGELLSSWLKCTKYSLARHVLRHYAQPGTQPTTSLQELVRWITAP